MAENGGLMTYDDIAGFSVRLEPPIKVTYRDYEIYGCGPWSQGPTLPIALNILEGYDVKALGHNSAEYLHLITEALKAAFSDRHHHIGDPDFYPCRSSGCSRRSTRRPGGSGSTRAGPAPRCRARSTWERATATASHAAAPGLVTLPPDTSYVCVVDEEGNVFSATPSDGFSVPIMPGLGFVVSPRGSQSGSTRRRRPRCSRASARG